MARDQKTLTWQILSELLPSLTCSNIGRASRITPELRIETIHMTSNPVVLTAALLNYFLLFIARKGSFSFIDLMLYSTVIYTIMYIKKKMDVFGA